MAAELRHDRRQVQPRGSWLRRLPGGPLQRATVVLGDERHHPAVEITEVVRQLAVVDLRKPAPTKLPVGWERALAQEVVAERLSGELGNDFHWLDDVAERLADFL